MPENSNMRSAIVGRRRPNVDGGARALQVAAASRSQLFRARLPVAARRRLPTNGVRRRVSVDGGMPRIPTNGAPLRVTVCHWPAIALAIDARVIVLKRKMAWTRGLDR